MLKRKKIISIVLLLILIFGVFTGFLSSQKQPYANYIKRVKAYIRMEGFEFELYENLEEQKAFKVLLKDIEDKQIFMFGDYYRSKEVNLLATKTFIFLHKNAGYKDMLINIDYEYQDEYDKWLKTGKTDNPEFVPYFTREGEKLLREYYNSLPEDEKFRLLCMSEAAQDEGETFTSRQEYMSNSEGRGNDEAYREVVRGNKIKTFIRKLLDDNPEAKYFVYMNLKETSKYSDISFFKSEYERVGTYLNERNEITKGKVFSTTCAVRSGITNNITIVTLNSFNNLPFLIESVVGLDTKYYMLPLTKGFAKGSIFNQVREGGWSLDALSPIGTTALVDTIYNKINERWDYLFYFAMVSPWRR
ncbi:MAG: hypothetical protein ACOCV8_01845 [Spirochaetota bacterium]